MERISVFAREVLTLLSMPMLIPMPVYFTIGCSIELGSLAIILLAVHAVGGSSNMIPSMPRTMPQTANDDPRNLPRLLAI